MVVGAGCFSLLLLAFDAAMAFWIFVPHVRAASFPTVQGLILESRVEVTRGADDTSHMPIIRYAYEVDGVRHEGSQIRHSGGLNDCGIAYALVARFPAGSVQPVFYDPTDPADAVLVAGWTGADVTGLLILFPFNLFMVAIWTSLGLAAVARARGPSAAGVPTRVIAGGVTRLILPRFPAVGVGTIAMGAAAVASVAVIHLLIGPDHSMRVAATGWGVVPVAGVGGWWAWRRRYPGDSGDVLIDDARRTITLPLDRRTDTRLTLGFAQVVDVTVAVETKKDDGELISTYRPTVHWNVDRNLQASAVISTRERETAERLADYLRRRLVHDHSGPATSAAATTASRSPLQT
ncbi:MAG TPA: DUF3592 domain-containing protein [Humisphaera sp.]